MLQIRSKGLVVFQAADFVQMESKLSKRRFPRFRCCLLGITFIVLIYYTASSRTAVLIPLKYSVVSIFVQIYYWTKVWVISVQISLFPVFAGDGSNWGGFSTSTTPGLCRIVTATAIIRSGETTCARSVTWTATTARGIIARRWCGRWRIFLWRCLLGWFRLGCSSKVWKARQDYHV